MNFGLHSLICRTNNVDAGIDAHEVIDSQLEAQS